jgi:hypothetical protein
MTLHCRFSGFVLAALVLAGGLISAASAQAEDLVDFLWGGSDEYGGGRSVVSFDPKYKPNQIIVSFSDRRLYLITKPGEAITYPVAVPKGDARWQGVTTVSNKRVNPPWTPTPDMVRQNPRLPRWVPGGHPMNPLGIRAMYLGSSAYRIHGTDAPWTIGQAVSHGCIRMTNQDVLDLYPRVPIGMRVTVTWQRFSTRPIASGSSYPRYGDDSDRSSNDSGYGQNAPSSRAAYNKPQGSIGSLFSWGDEPPTRTNASIERAQPVRAVSASATVEESDDNEAVDATVEIDDQPVKKKTASTSSETKKKPASVEKTVEKKSVSTSSPTKKNAVPDPIKPHEAAPADPAPTKSSMIEHAGHSS